MARDAQIVRGQTEAGLSILLGRKEVRKGGREGGGKGKREGGKGRVQVLSPFTKYMSSGQSLNFSEL